jgi:hypothetical protein
MKCPKCEGLMFVERFSDYFLTFYAWKCINCGAVMDHTILSHKHNQGEWSMITELALTRALDD